MTGTRNRPRLALLLAVTVIAWLCAWKTGYHVYERLERDHPGPIGFGGASALAPALLAIAGAVAGMVGSATTVVGIIIVSRDFRSVANCVRTVAIGAAAGVLLACNSGGRACCRCSWSGSRRSPPRSPMASRGRSRGRRFP